MGELRKCELRKLEDIVSIGQFWQDLARVCKPSDFLKQLVFQALEHKT